MLETVRSNLQKTTRARDKVSLIVFLIDTASVLEPLVVDDISTETRRLSQDFRFGAPDTQLLHIALDELDEVVDDEELEYLLPGIYASVLACLSAYAIYRQDIQEFRPNTANR